MSGKPIIAYIEREGYGTFAANHQRDALSYFLREHCGCQIVQYHYTHDFEADLSWLRKHTGCNQLILVIIKQEQYSDQHLNILQLVRTKLSKNLPIVVIPEGWGDEQFSGIPGDNAIYIFDHTDPELIDLVNHLVALWKPLNNWLGAESSEDQVMLMKRLEKAYRQHYLSYEDDLTLGTPDIDHMVIAEALRIRLLPAEFIKAEYDDIIEQSFRAFIPTTISTYEQETEKIKLMSDIERRSFANMLLTARGCKPCADGIGLIQARGSYGEGVNGFAIDPITLESLITYTTGEHRVVGNLLAKRILIIEALRNRKKHYEIVDENEQEWRCCCRLITGLIFSSIKGFTTPILQIYTGEATEDQIRKVANFINLQRKYILVYSSGHLVSG